ncbi:hypothetical protein HHI36_010832 [Cryptolaemus montrouzieri]|uniref:Pre-mRNA cleavage complex 2 protein Pcf11 n=1 Tax=Cryptolaemus montrouzieri TaxID=559131 RepID=A0ABD2MJY7_9CUCU
MVSEDVKAYVSSLADLTFNSKPLINMLTMLADENVAHAEEIVEVVENHLTKVKIDVKLPILYLIDCIVKNVGGPYTELFSQNIVATFCSVFRVVDEKTRAEMFKLRQTWNEVFSPKKLYAIDVQINSLDPAWPVTAPVPPNSSIHLNPKFLKSSSNAPSQVKTPVVPVVPLSNAHAVTLDMQQKLIQKQKELIDLQQKKVELELLQTKVRLREQISGGNISGMATSLPQNVLLKPEVAKQLLPPSARTSTIEDSKNKQISASNASRIPTIENSKLTTNNMKNQRMQMSTANNGPRIQPVNSALVAAAVNRPIRDPRLLRQQQNQQVHQKQSQNNSNINVQLENKNSLETSNKIVNSKMSVRDIQNDPRLKNSNDIVPTQKFTDDNKPKSRITPKSRSDKNQIRSSRNKSHSDESKSSKSSSSSSLDSPKKPKSEKSSPSKSTSRNRRRESPLPESKSFKSSREPKASKSDTALPVFKDVKSSKTRNYVRRNRSPQFSPEPSSQDVDLRLNGPPEKQPRILASPDKKVIAPQNVIRESSPTTIQTMDVDLRQLPTVIGKKRLSTDSPEQAPVKKSKNEIFDVLFGNEDTDLRKFSAPASDRPPTPPPPIISSSDIVIEEQKEPQPQKSNLQAVRAKLAANLKKSNPPFRRKTEDQDLRVGQVSSTLDTTNKIIISKDEDEKIKEGGMTALQQKELMNKIIAQIEAQKLQEAKKKNFEESLANTSLTPVSDDELETDFNEEIERARKDSPLPPSFGDKDERVLPPMHVVSQSDENFQKRFGREIRRGGPNWRGARGRRYWEAGPQVRPPLRPWMQPPTMNWPRAGNFQPPFPNMHPHDNDQNERRSPEGPTDIVLESASQEDIKTITIDGLPRDIRYYDELAIIFMNWDEPREISFQDGTRRVNFNDTDMYMMNFNEPYREYRIGESLHQVRLGGPSREIYIDYKPYECYFGGPGITIDLDGKVTSVKLDGPPPQVKIGDCRTDLVAGKIKLIIDAKTIVPIFLDAKVQTFSFNGEQHTVQFVPGLKSVLINNENFDVQFGGLPKPVMLKNKRHYIRFSVLPKGLKPGNVKIKGLESDEVTSSPRMEDCIDINEPALPIPQRVIKAYDPTLSPDNSNSATLFQNVQQQSLHNLDFLTNVISSTEQSANSSSYQIENKLPQQPETNPNPTSNAFNLGSINDLFQKLVASGMVTTSAALPPKEILPVPIRDRNRHGHKQSKKYPPMKPVSFAKPEQLKIRQGALYEKLYSGMQCSSCGMRFPPEQSMYYSQHLDWHFRQNRRGKKNARVASSRKWYYSISDWQNYEEIENLEEREKNYFDQQQGEGVADAPVEESELPSVTADPELQDICEVCGDKFEIFFNEDKEEWQFKNAIRVDDKTYHPICYEEYQQSLQNATFEQTNSDNQVESNTIPGIEIVLDDDDEIEKTEEIDEVILDESDESKQANDDKKEEPEEHLDHVEDDDDDDDDDVIIKEETIEQIILDDDDDKMDEEETQLSSKSSSQSQSPRSKEAVEVIDDGFMDVSEGLLMLQNGMPIKVKTEPIDEADEENEFDTSLVGGQDLSLEVLEEAKEPEIGQTHASFVPSIDGNLEMDTSAPTPVTSVSGKIKINIHKPLPVIPAKDSNKDIFSESDTLPETVIDPSQPLPPGEEPILLKLKPALQGVHLKKLPPVQKGSELTGMCSIM